jgi:hypothetical protein
MTETEWLTATHPNPLIDFLRDSGRLSPRKTRLFCVAAVRRAWPLLIDQRSRRAIEIAEQDPSCPLCEWTLMEGLVPPGDFTREAEQAAIDLTPTGDWVGWDVRRAAQAAAEALAGQPHATAGDVAAAIAMTGRERMSGTAWYREGEHQCRLLRDLVGDPFRAPPPFARTWLTSAVIELGQRAYKDRILPEGTLDPTRLRELAQALVDAGCENEDLVEHLRAVGPHVQGCWAVDRVLGKA